MLFEEASVFNVHHLANSARETRNSVSLFFYENQFFNSVVGLTLIYLPLLLYHSKTKRS